MLYVKVSIPDLENMKVFLKLLMEWGISREEIIKSQKLKESKENILHVQIYVNEKQYSQLRDLGFSVKILLDLSTIKDPRHYASKTNRFVDELERLKQKPRRK